MDGRPRTPPPRGDLASKTPPVRAAEAAELRRHHSYDGSSSPSEIRAKMSEKTFTLWYLSEGRTKCGPLSLGDATQHIELGELTTATRVCGTGMRSWCVLGQYSAFCDAHPGTPAVQAVLTLERASKLRESNANASRPPFTDESAAAVEGAQGRPALRGALSMAEVSTTGGDTGQEPAQHAPPVAPLVFDRKICPRSYSPSESESESDLYDTDAATSASEVYLFRPESAASPAPVAVAVAVAVPVAVAAKSPAERAPPSAEAPPGPAALPAEVPPPEPAGPLAAAAKKAADPSQLLGFLAKMRSEKLYALKTEITAEHQQELSSEDKKRLLRVRPLRPP